MCKSAKTQVCKSANLQKNQKPKTKNQKPKTKNQKPKTKDQKPKTKDQKPKRKFRLKGLFERTE